MPATARHLSGSNNNTNNSSSYNSNSSNNNNATSDNYSGSASMAAQGSKLSTPKTTSIYQDHATTQLGYASAGDPQHSYTQHSHHSNPHHGSASGSSEPAAPEVPPEKPAPQPIHTAKVAMTPAEALKRHSDKLTAFEQSEILEFQHIWFTGPSAAKIKGIPHTANNNGYDDERGDYKVVLGDHLEYRYEVLSTLGRGSFGQVVKVLDMKKDCFLALKIIRNKKRFHHQAMVEVRILEHLMSRDRENRYGIVRVHGYFYFRNHLCITFEPLSLNLYEFIKSYNFRGLQLSVIKKFATQLLTSLAFLRKEKVIHCDLKPENVLLKSLNKTVIRLIDFGSSCFENERVYSYIQSRFYRSPEVLMGHPYDTAIDMWSFGCILCELYTGYPLFPGENEPEQMQCLMEVLGPPPVKMVQMCTRKKAFFDADGNPLLIPNSRGRIRQPSTKPLATAIRCTDPLFVSFIKRCLRWDPKTRWSPEQAMEHPWVNEAAALALASSGGGGGALSASSSCSDFDLADENDEGAGAGAGAAGSAGEQKEGRSGGGAGEEEAGSEEGDGGKARRRAGGKPLASHRQRGPDAAAQLPPVDGSAKGVGAPGGGAAGSNKAMFPPINQLEFKSPKLMSTNAVSLTSRKEAPRQQQQPPPAQLTARRPNPTLAGGQQKIKIVQGSAIGGT
jgi:dual specificity tyrosine-phosphorylation-regulated kinase 2/3/4